MGPGTYVAAIYDLHEGELHMLLVKALDANEATGKALDLFVSEMDEPPEDYDAMVAEGMAYRDIALDCDLEIKVLYV